MPKNWAAYRDEIVELYSHGHTLESVRRILKERRGFQASTRAYRLKLCEWRVWKNKSMRRTSRSEESPKTPPPSPVEVQLHSRSRRSSFSQGIFDEAQWDQGKQRPILSILNHEPTHNPSSTITPPTISPTFLQLNPPDLNPNPIPNPSGAQVSPSSPIINTSLSFFSSRPDHESLSLLANTSSLSHQAIDILLLNWKPTPEKGLYMGYAQTLLRRPECCQSILNYINTWPCSKTKFDLVYEYVPADEQELLISALLSADLAFAADKPLKGLYPPSAETWRKAAAEKNWVDAKRVLYSRNPKIKNAAVMVMKGWFEERERSLRGSGSGSGSGWGFQGLSTTGSSAGLQR